MSAAGIIFNFQIYKFITCLQSQAIATWELRLLAPGKEGLPGTSWVPPSKPSVKSTLGLRELIGASREKARPKHMTYALI